MKSIVLNVENHRDECSWALAGFLYEMGWLVNQNNPYAKKCYEKAVKYGKHPIAEDRLYKINVLYP